MRRRAAGYSWWVRAARVDDGGSGAEAERAGVARDLDAERGRGQGIVR